MKDVILAIRADEAHHRVVNHTLANMKPNEFNPYKPGEWTHGGLSPFVTETVRC